MSRLIYKFILFLFLIYTCIEVSAFILSPPPYPNPINISAVIYTPYFTESKSFAVKTNNYGFRNDENFSFPITKDKPKILLLGDSMIFGGTNTYPVNYYLSRHIPGYRIFNGGAIGRNIPFYFEMLKYYYPKIKPEYVFIGLFLGNDFMVNTAEQAKSARYKAIQVAKKIFPCANSFYMRWKLVKVGKAHGIRTLHHLSDDEFRSKVISQVGSLSSGLSLNTAKYTKLAQGYDYKTVLIKYPELKYVEFSEIIANAIIFRDAFMENFNQETPHSQKCYMDNFSYIRKIRDYIESQKEKTELVFILIPVSFMVDAKYADFYKYIGYNLPPAERVYPLYKRLKQDLLRENFCFLDLNCRIKTSDIFFTEDYHFSENGNRFLAVQIADWVRKK